MTAIYAGGVPAETLELVHMRVSQINGCDACIASGVASAARISLSPERLLALPAWRQSALFDEAERSALAIAEAATRLADRQDAVTDEIWANATRHHDDQALSALVSMIALTNFFNRVNTTIRVQPGRGHDGRAGTRAPTRQHLGTAPACVPRSLTFSGGTRAVVSLTGCHDAVMPEPPRVIQAEEVEALQGPGTLTWHPVRHTLGIRAFGCNAYTAHDVGADVVEPHTENHSGHEELYYVASGHARFTIDGSDYESPAGTYVFIPDPRSHRHAVAGEAGTTVLSFGGPPMFEPSAWEWAFRASAVRSVDLNAAREILRDGLVAHPADPSLLYELACLAAGDGTRAEALALLGRAIAGSPRLRDRAREDGDFATLRADPEFDALTSD